MPFLSDEDKKRAREMDALTYLMTCEPDNLVRVSANEYCTREHDSLKISNGKWHWHSRQIGGRNALDYLMKVKEMTYYEAAKLILSLSGITPTANIPYEHSERRETKKDFTLPEKAYSNRRIIQYLMGRGISKNVICYCIENGFLYQSYPRNNCVFVGYDENETPRYAGLRGTTPARFMGDVEGSDKAYSFRLVQKGSTSVHIFESAIDLLSYATLLEMDGKDWTHFSMIAVAGVAQKSNNQTDRIPVALEKFLDGDDKVQKIYLHLDNDFAGRNATAAYTALLSDRYTVIDNPVPIGKDVNDFLKHERGIPLDIPVKKQDCR